VNNIALFVRVSRKDQSYDRQVSELTEFARSRSCQVIKIIEEKISGSKTKLQQRPGIQELFQLVGEQKISKVIVSEVSRLGRRTRDILEIIDFLHAHGVSLVVYNYNLETLDSKGKVNSMAQFLITLLGDIGRMETETLSERTKSGMAEAKRKGKQIGRPSKAMEKQELLGKYPMVAKDLKNGESMRKIAAFRKVSLDTVQRVKKALN
jgi:DNA invertase Pin-like site-specific DNA recombinase